MFGLEALTGSTRAVATVGLVLVEAIILYLGYGALSQTVGSAVIDTIVGDHQ
ncbi:DUF7512 family protein [Haloparvum sp. AD34]